MVIDVLVVHGVREQHGASRSRALVDEAVATGLRAERVGLFDAAPSALRALYTRTSSLLDRASESRYASAVLGSVGSTVRDRMFRSLLDTIRTRRPRLIVATDSLALAVVEAAKRDRIGFPPVTDATVTPIAESACHAVDELASRGPLSPRRVLVAAANLPPDEIRAVIRSFSRTLGVAVDIHTGLDERRRVFAEHELELALVAGEVRGTHGPLADRLATADLVVGRAQPALLWATMAGGRAFLALPERTASEHVAVALMLRADAGLRTAPEGVGALVAQTVDFERAARLGANGRRALRAVVADSPFAPLRAPRRAA